MRINPKTRLYYLPKTSTPPATPKGTTTSLVMNPICINMKDNKIGKRVFDSHLLQCGSLSLMILYPESFDPVLQIGLDQLNAHFSILCTVVSMF